MRSVSRWTSVVSLLVMMVLAGCGDTAEEDFVEEDTLRGDVPTSGESIIQIVQENDQMEQLAQLIERAGLTETLQQEGPFTVFAPTDAAFVKMTSDTLRGIMQDTERLRDLLFYHVLPEPVALEQVPSMETATTLQGETVTFGASDRGAMVNDALIVTPNIEASNGIVHAVDGVLHPPDAQR